MKPVPVKVLLPIFVYKNDKRYWMLKSEVLRNICSGVKNPLVDWIVYTLISSNYSLDIL